LFTNQGSLQWTDKAAEVTAKAIRTSKKVLKGPIFLKGLCTVNDHNVAWCHSFELL
jgi:hypothetical protein